MKVTVTINISGSATKEAVVLEFDRNGPVKASSLGLTLREAKAMLRQVQREIVEAQIAEQRICRECGNCRSVKDRHTVCFKSLFGGVDLLIPRLKACIIDKRMSKSQQMRWSHPGAHLLLQVRVEVVDGRLGEDFARWYPGFRGVEVEAHAA